VTNLLKKKKLKKEKNLQTFAAANLQNINDVLKKHRPKDKEVLRQAIMGFMNSILQGNASKLELPANFEPGIASLLLNNMAYWLGNTQEMHKTKRSIENMGD